jgi:hypothetical protein
LPANGADEGRLEGSSWSGLRARLTGGVPFSEDFRDFGRGAGLARFECGLWRFFGWGC